jgi:hypothetical protein
MEILAPKSFVDFHLYYTLFGKTGKEFQERVSSLLGM